MKKVIRIIFVVYTGPFVFMGFIASMTKASYKVGVELSKKFIDWI